MLLVDNWRVLVFWEICELKRHIYESVKSVAREKVYKQLYELLELDIFEEVPEGPPGWISSLVVVPMGNGNVRVCVDMRRAKEAIIRERHPIPTVNWLERPHCVQQN